MSESRYIVFRLDDERYSMDLRFVKAIEDNYVIIPVPNGPDDIRGIISLRGDVIPVYSLRSKFGKDEFRGDGKLLVAYVCNTMIGFEVDVVEGIETIEDSDVLPVPTVVVSEETAYIDCIVNTSKGIVINISVEHILTDGELANIEDMIAQNQI